MRLHEQICPHCEANACGGRSNNKDKTTLTSAKMHFLIEKTAFCRRAKAVKPYNICMFFAFTKYVIVFMAGCAGLL